MRSTTREDSPTKLTCGSALTALTYSSIARALSRVLGAFASQVLVVEYRPVDVRVGSDLSMRSDRIPLQKLTGDRGVPVLLFGPV